jgi:hypothetical protein
MGRSPRRRATSAMLTPISTARTSKMISSTIHICVPLDEDFRAVAEAVNVAGNFAELCAAADPDPEPAPEPEAAPEPEPAGSAAEVTVGVSGKL